MAASASEDYSGSESEGSTIASPRASRMEYFGGRNNKGEKHGRGRVVHPNGDTYLGCFYRGQRHGLGVYRYKNGRGARYGGDWTRGEKQGWGTLIYPDGSQYTGTWERGQRHGWGIYVYPNGDEYEGWWYMGERNGRGIYRTRENCEKFVGDWILGQRQGQGLIIRGDHKFMGTWDRDVPKGPGIFQFPDLDIEQHGVFTHLRVMPGLEDRWRREGHQVRMVNSTEEDSINPLTIERELFEEGNKNQEEMWEEMVAYVKLEVEKRDKGPLTPVVPLWRGGPPTKLVTPTPDEDVPPPSMPPTPLPPLEPEEVETPEVRTQRDETDEEVDHRISTSHHLEEPYMGSGVCQESHLGYTPKGEVYNRFSEMSLSGVGEFREQVSEKVSQLGSNAGISESERNTSIDRWRYTLRNGKQCLAPPPGSELPPKPIAPAQETPKGGFKPKLEFASIAERRQEMEEASSVASSRRTPSKSSQSSKKSDQSLSPRHPSHPHTLKEDTIMLSMSVHSEVNPNEQEEEEEEVDEDLNKGMSRFEEEALDPTHYVVSESSEGEGEESEDGPVIVIDPTASTNVIVDAENKPIALEEKMKDFKESDD